MTDKRDWANELASEVIAVTIAPSSLTSSSHSLTLVPRLLSRKTNGSKLIRSSFNTICWSSSWIGISRLFSIYHSHDRASPLMKGPVIRCLSGEMREPLGFWADFRFWNREIYERSRLVCWRTPEKKNKLKFPLQRQSQNCPRDRALTRWPMLITAFVSPVMKVAVKHRYRVCEEHFVDNRNSGERNHRCQTVHCDTWYKLRLLCYQTGPIKRRQRCLRIGPI